MELDTVVLLRDTIFKNIKYFNKSIGERIQPPIIIRLDNDVRIDTGTTFVLWDDTNQVAYYFANTKPFSQVQPIGANSINFPAILSSFSYGEIQEIYMVLNKEAFGQAAAVINAYAPNARPTFCKDNGQPITEEEYRKMWQKLIDSSDMNKVNLEYRIDATVTFKANGGTGDDKIVNVMYTGTTVELSNGSEFTAPAGKKFKSWNTAPDGSGRELFAGYKLTPTSKNLVLYAIWE